MPSTETGKHPPGEVQLVRQVFEDIDEQAECLTGYDQKYQQLGRGRFEGQFSTALLGPELGLYFERLNQVLDQSGAVPRDQYSVIFLMNEDRPCKLNGRDFSSDDLFLGHPGSGFHTMSRPGTHFCVVSVEKEYFESRHIANRPDGKTGFEGRREGIHETSPASARQIRRIVKQALGTIENTPWVLANPGALSGLRASLAGVVSDQVAGATPGSMSDRHPGRIDHPRVVRRARAFILENTGNDITIASVCRHVGISRRTLEYSFQVCMEQSPAAWLRLVRLNEIRRALRLPENRERSIGDIAAQWGVWHLSRFAQYYRHQFGELPSQMRNRLSN